MSAIILDTETSSTDGNACEIAHLPITITDGKFEADKSQMFCQRYNPLQSISIAATCQQAMLIDADGQCVGSTNAMPSFMPTLLEIDLATGMIKNWTVPTGEQLQAIADANVSPMRKALDLVESPSFFQDRIKPSLLTKQRMAELMQQSKQVEIDTFKPSEVMPDTTAVLEKYMPQMTNLVDVSDSKPLEIEGFDEPTESDTGLCPDVPDSFYAAPVTPPVIDVAKIVSYGASLSIGTLPDDEPVAKKPSVDIGVSFSKETGKWVADIENDVVGEHQATSTQGKFEAIKNVLKKAGLNGVYEINQRDSIDDVEFYSYDDSRTKDRMSIYVSGHKVSKDCVASTSKGHRYTAPSRAQALDGLIANVLKVVLPDDAIVDTTDDAMLFAEKLRYSIDMAKAVAIVEPEPTTTDIEDAPQPICQPARPRYRNPDDHSQTWTGRGKPPQWLQAKLDAGEQLTDYAISDSAA